MLRPDEFERCKEIWDIDRQKNLAEKFLKELIEGNRVIFVCKESGHLLGEISLVKEMNDEDYTVPGQRIYVSHLVVKKEKRRKGIGKLLVNHVIEKAKEAGYSEMTIGVDLDNYAALKLYSDYGFNRILRIDQDAQGAYIKLMKCL